MGLIPLGFWAASGSGGGGAAADYELISTTVLGSSAASVTFSGLGTSAAAYKHLQIRAVARSDAGSQQVGYYSRFNGDSGANYSSHYLGGNGSVVYSGAATSQTAMAIAPMPGSTYSANVYHATVIDILDFASSTKNKTWRSLSGFTGSNTSVEVDSNAWLSTAAITSIVLYPASGNLITGSRFSLYGLK